MELHYQSTSPQLNVAFIVECLLSVMLYGGIESTQYAIKYQEHSPSMWRPLMWPIKSMMCFGIFMMLLQAISELFKDIATLKGKPI